MEHSKLANGNGHGAQNGRSAFPAQQDQMSMVRSAGRKAVQKKTASVPMPGYLANATHGRNLRVSQRCIERRGV
jgi:hypothetical protein